MPEENKQEEEEEEEEKKQSEVVESRLDQPNDEGEQRGQVMYQNHSGEEFSTENKQDWETD